MKFDNVSERAQNQMMMSDRRLTVCLALALVAAMATSALASCMAGPAMTADSEMACCKAGHVECGMRTTADPCCKSDSQKQQQLIAAKHELVKSPLTALKQIPAVVSGDLVTIRPTSALFAHVRLLPKSPAAPTYLLVSALLI